MEAKKEREFHLKDDRVIKGSLLLQRSKVLNFIATAFFNMVCSFFRKLYRGKNQQSKAIAVLSFHRIGDTVFTIPAVEQIINNYPEFEVYIFTYPETKSIYKLKFSNVKIIPVDKNEFKFGRRVITKKAKKLLTELKPQMIFDITGTPASASMIFNSGAERVIGMNIPYLKNLYTDYVPIRTQPHFMDIYMDVVKQVINVTGEKEHYKFDTQINSSGKIFIHPFAIRKPKEWLLKRFIELAVLIKKDYDVEIIAPPGFIDEDTTNEIRQLSIPLTVTKSLDDLIDKTKECSVFISNDSGPTYIAALLGKPTFTIYGPTNPKYSLPFGGKHAFIQKQLSCSAVDEKFCFTMGGINCPSNECMQLLTVEEVYKSVEAFLHEINFNGIKTET